MSTSSVPALLRQQVDRWAETWLRTKFSRFLELRAQDPGPFNYPIAVFSEWRGKAFYLRPLEPCEGGGSRRIVRFIPALEATLRENKGCNCRNPAGEVRIR